MKFVHSVTVSVFVKERGNLGKAKETILGFFPSEKVKLSEQKAEGFDGEITILEVDARKERPVNSFIKNLLNRLTEEQKERILSQKESRMDDNLFFYLRFEKEPAEKGELVLTDKGSCYHVKMLMAAYPKKKEKGLEAIEKLFKHQR